MVTLSETWTAPANAATVQALLVGGGGAGLGYGGGGGSMAFATLNTTDPVTVVAGYGGDDSAEFDHGNGGASTVTQAGTTTTAAGGQAGDLQQGASGTNAGNTFGTDSNYGALGGGGAGGAAPAGPTGEHLGFDGGAGLIVSAAPGVTSLFADDATCYAGGGAVTGFENLNSQTVYFAGTPGCRGGSTASLGDNNFTVTPPDANTGAGGTGSLYGYRPEAGAMGVVVIRYTLATPTTTTTAALAHTGSSSSTYLFASLAALLSGLSLLARARTRRTQ